jgi:hypothetical protein
MQNSNISKPITNNKMSTGTIVAIGLGIFAIIVFSSNCISMVF